MCCKMSNLKLAGMTCLLTLALAISASATTWDAFADWSHVNNPNASWTYGTRATLAGDLTAFDANVMNGEWEVWQKIYNPPATGSWSFTHGAVEKAPWSTVALITEGGTYGSNYTVIRWTAAAAGTINIDYSAGSIWDCVSTGSLLVNGVQIAGGAVNGTTTQAYIGSVVVSAGDTIEAVCNAASATQYANTKLTLTTAAVPEPSSILAMLSGIVGLGGMSLRRKRK